MELRTILRTIRDSGDVVLALGCGITGIETARALSRAGITVRLVERQDEADFRAKSKFRSYLPELESLGVELRFGIDGERIAEHLDRVKLCVLSPGISLESAVVGAVKRLHVPWIGELELGVHLFEGKSVIVTGSNGKSTTVSLIDAMLRASGKPSILCGNVGSPVISHLDKAQLLADGGVSRPETLVVEASSYQLEGCTLLAPDVGVFLNLSQNHLERHGTMERYLAAKAKLFALQNEEQAGVVNVDDEWGRKVLGEVRSRRFLICRSGGPGEAILRDPSTRAAGSAVIHYEPERGIDRVVVTFEGTEEYEVANCRLVGLHNRFDIGAAALAARVLGATKDGVRAALETFEPLEHRLEFTVDTPELAVVNDSKATTVAATVAATQAILAQCHDRPIRLMLGGLSKAGSWEPVVELLKSSPGRFDSVLCFGKDGHLIRRLIEAAGVPVREFTGVIPAIDGAIENPPPRLVVLFSPGCASFDEFTDFEQRGAVFKSEVKARVSAPAAAGT